MNCLLRAYRIKQLASLIRIEVPQSAEWVFAGKEPHRYPAARTVNYILPDGTKGVWWVVCSGCTHSKVVSSRSAFDYYHTVIRRRLARRLLRKEGAV